MALDTVLLMRRRIFAAALESTTGTSATLNSAAAAFNCYDLKINGDVAYIERQAQGGFGNMNGMIGAAKGTITFWTHLSGVGSGSGSHANLLLASGFTAVGGVYTASAAANQSLTIGGFHDGRLFEMAGCQGNCVINIKAGEPVKMEWTFHGVWIAPTSVALATITPTYPTLVPPRAVSSTITIGSVAYKFPELKIDIGNNVIMREDVSSAGGYRSAWITNRAPKITVAPEALALATQDWYAAYLAATQYALSAAIGSVAGNIITITSTAIQQNKLPEVAERNGLLVDGLSLDVNNDSLVVTFS